MIKEMHRGIYNALCMENVTLLANDLTEPLVRRSIKIFIRPVVTRYNSNVRMTEFDIVLVYLSSDPDNYYMEQYDMIERFEERLMQPIRLENGVVIEPEELEFEQDGEELIITTGTTIDTFIDSEEDMLLMEELGLNLQNG